MYTLDELLALPTPAVAQWLRDQDPAFGAALPVNGTRRWWTLERPGAGPADGAGLRAYLRAAQLRHLETVGMLHAHGIAVVLAPVMGQRLITRRDDAYREAIFASLCLFTRTPEALAFYRASGMRVCFYGGFRQVLRENGLDELLAEMDELAAQTAAHAPQGPLLLYGLWAHDTVSAAVTHTVAFFQEHGRAPSHAELIRCYYGLPLHPLRLYIGMGKQRYYDIPLLEHRRMSLLYCVTPTLALSPTALRKMLFDLLVTREVPERDPLAMTPDQRARLAAYFAANADQISGVGVYDETLGYWIPDWRHVPPAAAAGLTGRSGAAPAPAGRPIDSV